MPLNVQLARGDIWVVDFGSNPKDPEQSLIRPAVIVSDDRLHHPNLKMVIVVPSTTTVRGVSLHVVVAPDADNGLDQPTVFQIEQLRAVSHGRLQQRLGYLDAVSRYAVDEIMRNVLSL